MANQVWILICSLSAFLLLLFVGSPFFNIKSPPSDNNHLEDEIVDQMKHLGISFISFEKNDDNNGTKNSEQKTNK